MKKTIFYILLFFSIITFPAFCSTYNTSSKPVNYVSNVASFYEKLKSCTPGVSYEGVLVIKSNSNGMCNWINNMSECKAPFGATVQYAALQSNYLRTSSGASPVSAETYNKALNELMNSNYIEKYCTGR